MKLTMDEKEIKGILLAWAETQFGPNTFNSVNWRAEYGHVDAATLEFDESLVEPPKIEPADEGTQA